MIFYSSFPKCVKWKTITLEYFKRLYYLVLFIHTMCMSFVLVHISVTRNICSICLFQKTKAYVMYNDQAPPEKTAGHKAHSKGWCLSALNRATQKVLQSILLVGSSVYV